MEHRWSERRPACCPVRFTYPQSGRRVQGVARNISLGGMFIETGPDTPPVGALIELSFSFDAGADTVHSHVLGQVVHTTPQGAGVMFCDLGVPLVRTLREAIYGEEKRAARA